MNFGDIMLRRFFQFVSGVSGVVLAPILIVVIAAALAFAPWFNWTTNAISDLGRPQYGLLFVNTAFVSVGAFLFLFSGGLIFTLQQRIGPMALALSSLYFIGVGLFPLPSPIHVETSSLFFIAFSFGFFFLGVKLRQRGIRECYRL